MILEFTGVSLSLEINIILLISLYTVSLCFCIYSLPSFYLSDFNSIVNDNESARPEVLNLLELKPPPPPPSLPYHVARSHRICISAMASLSQSVGHLRLHSFTKKGNSWFNVGQRKPQVIFHLEPIPVLCFQSRQF